jgi:cytochrome c-type biogenesis protein CcmH/NrfG
VPAPPGLGLRLAVLGAAAVGCAWFVLGLVQARDQAAASAIVSRLSALTPAQSARAAGLLATAGTLNPDRQIDLLRAELRLHRHDVRGAAAILRAVVRDEPDDVAAWDLLGAALRGTDPAGARAANARVRELVPPVPLP